MTAVLDFVGQELVQFGARDSRWIDLKRFSIAFDGSDEDLLAALLSHPEYRDSYAGDGPAEERQHDVHGPYRLRAITVDSFHRIESGTAREIVQTWVAEPVARSQGRHDELRVRVLPLLDTAVVYELADLRAVAQHDWGWVVGITGFHEFVAIDRPNRVLTLLVASDD